jgi:hypothetical protein
VLLKDIAEACRELGLSCVWPSTISSIAAQLVLHLDFTEEQLRKILRASNSDRVRRAAKARLNGG